MNQSSDNIKPPRWADRLLEWFCAPHLLEEVQGDLYERFQKNIRVFGLKTARKEYVVGVLSFIKPFALKRNTNSSPPLYIQIMISNYFKVAFRNLLKYKGYSFINIFGLAAGMAVTMLIGLWVHDELSYNKHFKNYDRLGHLFQFVKFDVEKSTYDVMPIPLAAELRTKYPDFEAVSLSSNTHSLILASGEKKFIKTGNYVEPSFVDMVSVKMVMGNRNGLKDVNAILISESLAEDFFGLENPLDKVIKIDNKESVKVVGVYEDFPYNTTFKEVLFLASWSLYEASRENVRRDKGEWDSNSYQIYAQLKQGADFDKVSAKIKDIRVNRADPPGYKPEFFVHPMSKWHLYSDFKDGINTGGLIEFVWLFGIIGAFVLLLACINFMNLSTARSEKRAKEVGIRKAVGSIRGQLIIQFFSESFLVVLFAFVLSILIVQLALPLFNQIADKKIGILWTNPLFWFTGLGFSLITGLVAGSYPAFYLSSFQAVKVLKGTFRMGRFAAVPRKVLVVLQFTVSVTLIIGTVVVFRQIQYAKNRSVGYDRNKLIEVNMNTPELYKHFKVLKTDLQNSGAVYEVGVSAGSITNQSGGTTNISWKGKSPEGKPLLMANLVSHEYGKTIGWQVVKGRDFSRTFSTDSAAMIINESALKMMGFKDPLNEIVTTNGRAYKVIGVIKDMIKENPFRPVAPSFFIADSRFVNVILVKLAPAMSTSEALSKVETVFRKHNPESPFVYSFVDDLYGKKFGDEERIGKLALFFTILAVLISCLGLFGLASFVAEQRTKEIGVRKVLGASVAHLWALLSKDFVMLVILALFIASPVAYYFMNQWMMRYDYRAGISWWIFAAAGAGALLITLLTVSFQAIKAALMNPVRSLRSE
ncbi:ABC transporter permease [Emticicia sp. BO119]|uniref:ABC transporter permease n=1 Tax=Emticicia sp. BO119 TaxID=2757768 RepID=UPI00286E3236|nr:ABC transporter permease [Emticicia sp. BO119]